MSESEGSSQTPAYIDIAVVFILLAFMSLTVVYVMRLGRSWRKKEADLIDLMDKKEPDAFERLNGYSWDLVVVFKHPKKTFGTDVPISALEDGPVLRFAYELSKSDLECVSFLSIQDDEVYVKIRAPVTRLLLEAERTRYKLLYDPTELRSKLERGGTTIPEMSPVTPLNAYDFIYGAYHDKYKSMFIQHPANDKTCGLTSVLKDTDRIRLLLSIIGAPKASGGCGVSLDRLVRKGTIIGYSPAHSYAKLEALTKRWLVFCQSPWNKDVVDGVRDYFGEKIALYVLWLQHSLQWLCVGAAVGALAWINVATENNDPNAPDIPFYAAFLAVWATLVLEFWKRKESSNAMRWGTSEFEEVETERGDFQGTKCTSPVDGTNIIYFPRFDYFLRLTASSMFTLGLILVVVITIMCLFLLKIALRSSKELYYNGLEIGGIIVPFMQSTIMVIFDYLYSKVAAKLNKFENHRTETEHEDSLIVKIMAFRFVNNYFALFYIAFVKPSIPDFDACTNNSCLKELQITLGTIFISKLLFNLVYTIMYPVYDQNSKEKANFKDVPMEKLASDLTLVERTFMKADYEELGGTLEDYATSIILFGFTTMFISAFPLATCMSLVNVFVEMRLVAWKLSYVYRRPVPRGACDMGSWYHILELFSTAAVLTNSGLVAFTGTYATSISSSGRIWIFVGMSSGILLLKFAIAVLIPDVPPTVVIQEKRNAFFHSKLRYQHIDCDQEGGGNVHPQEHDVRPERVHSTDDDP